MGFLANFSAPFLLAVAMWPVASFMLTVPVLAMLYHRDNRIGFTAALSAYGTVLYALGLLCFTLYPMPSDPGAYCATHHLAPQLNPFQFIGDIRSDGLTAIMQIAMNGVFFLPLGFIAKRVFRLPFAAAAVAGFLVSLLVETLQLTGVLGLFPCSYRLFDVDDLVWNTAGAVAGYGCAMLLDRVLPVREADTTTVTNPGFVRRLVAFIIDFGLATLCALPLTVAGDALYSFVSGRGLGVITNTDSSDPLDMSSIMMLLTLAVFEVVIPWMRQGRTLGGGYTHMTCETRPREGVRRIAFYAARFAVICCVRFPDYIPHAGLVLFATLVFWMIRKRMPYDLI
ncbi:VanZ family protein [Bifidobacterium sp. CP2]|uniref:VanZ family protein n=1 Tax=Bifidobacterium sp. CP2 TaxID=2809025 RepID=UPI001BDC5E04|nr:VanZ family protein [Bifidobacterium sp. CP2]MBT1181270.1 VanZ family protein [Bifidobacterium sp. CP2]